MLMRRQKGSLRKPIDNDSARWSMAIMVGVETTSRGDRRRLWAIRVSIATQSAQLTHPRFGKRRHGGC